jgi:hypothetical protein
VTNTLNAIDAPATADSPYGVGRRPGSAATNCLGGELKVASPLREGELRGETGDKENPERSPSVEQPTQRCPD